MEDRMEDKTWDRTEDRTEVRAAERPGSGLGALGQRSRSRLKVRTIVKGQEGRHLQLVCPCPQWTEVLEDLLSKWVSP